MTESDNREHPLPAGDATPGPAASDATSPLKAAEIDSTQLRQRLVERFSLEELKTLCVDLGVDFDELGGDTKTDKARELIEYLKRRERLPDLVALCSQLRPPVSAEAAGAEFSRSINPGLNALVELMKTPEVLKAVVAFSTGFQAASEQINRLSTYKRLHDLLHDLQLQCYVPLLGEVNRSASGELATDILSGYESTLQGILSELKEIAGESPQMASETTWIQDIAKAHETLVRALDNSEVELIQKTVGGLKRVIDRQPALINARLTTSAQNLRLPDLINAMKQVSDRVASLNLEAEKVEMFKTAVDALMRLNQRLATLISEHGQWQDLDGDLHRIEFNLGEDLSELTDTWADVKAKAEALCCGDTDDCITTFCKHSAELDNAIVASNPTKIKQVFNRYNRQASVCFYGVDKRLKKLCEDLLKVGEPLTLVLRMIE